ncbi:MAG: globin [Sphingobium sp.]
MNSGIRMTPYESIGGSDAVAAIVSRFYDLVERDPAYVELRALHGPDLSGVRVGLASFLAAWLGGPSDWAKRGLCVMSLHNPVAIDPASAEQWIDAMTRAISAQPDLDAGISAKMIEVLGQMARAMINRLPQPETPPLKRTLDQQSIY